jgi:hypothetical protein
VAERASRDLAVLIVRLRDSANVYEHARYLHTQNHGVVRVSRLFRVAAKFFRIRGKLFKIKRGARDSWYAPRGQDEPVECEE